MSAAEQTSFYHHAIVAFAAIVVVAALIATGGSAPAQADARVWIHIDLSASLSDVVPREHRAVLAGRAPGITAARRSARRSPGAGTRVERKFAARVERDRNAALPAIRRAARSAVRAQERVALEIQRLGGTIDRSNPVPGTIMAQVSKDDLAAITALESVERVAPAVRPHPMSSPIDGSPTWHTAGYSGQTPNSDNPSIDGPDVVIADSGITTNHVAFNVRRPSDCDTCRGTGDSADPAHPEAGPNTRVISTPNRTNFTGGGHGNTLAAIIGATDFTLGSSGRGVAFGIDKLYDSYFSWSPSHWSLGLTYMNEPGVADIAEVFNYSAGDYQDEIGYNVGWRSVDDAVSTFGQTRVISAGNCGLPESGYNGCNAAYPGVTHRVSTPANLFNVLAVGGLSGPGDDPATWHVWANSSPGPTWDGRKKPDLIASPSGGISHPRNYDSDSNGKFDDYGNNGTGTSNAAPQVAGGAALLASVGVYSPMAQRAILINTATPIQGQTYWTPTSGWGALNLDAAFHQRGNYATNDVHGAGPNSARFFQTTGVAVGDRATLAWNRRVSSMAADYFALTNLDLSQIAPSDPTGSTVTSTGGSDAADSVDTNLTPSGTPGNHAPTDNPMPGSGTDGGDNVEQIRSTATGTQILKVKAHSAVDGLTTEPFAIASRNSVIALQTPIPEVTLTPSVDLAAAGEQITITATVDNPSNDLALSSATVALETLPADVNAVGSTSAALGAIAPGGSASTTFTVEGTSDVAASISAAATGTTYGETFAGDAETEITFDGSPPEISIAALPQWSTTAAPTASWSASDATAGLASYDAEQQVAGGAWTPLVDAGAATSAQLSAPEGQTVAVRVRARDQVGNISAWAEASTSIDAVEPAIAFGGPSSASRGTLSVPASATNVGVPIVSSSYVFSVSGTGAPRPLTGAATFFNGGSRATSAILRVTAIDALGRTVTRSQTFAAPPRWLLAKLRVRKPKVKKRKMTISGTVTRAYRGRVVVTVKRRGKTGTRRVTKRVKVKSGRWSIAVKLKRGRYDVVADALQSGDFAAARARRSKVRVR